ncbi:MAG: type II toxin-antitoxin system VapC family toxin [Balneolaceae bacterium]
MKNVLADQRIYIDTSAIIPFYFKENFSAMTQDLFERYGLFQISELSKIEFYSTARKKARIGHTTNSEIEKVFRVFESHLNQGLFLITPFEKKHFKAATHIIKSTQNSLRSLDALHLGITYEEGLSVLSFDSIFNDTAQEFGISIISE